MPCQQTNQPSSGPGAVADRIPARADIPSAMQWDLQPLYAGMPDWEADFARIDALVAPLEALRGRLDSAAAVAQLFAAETELDRLLEKLYTYAHLRADEDTADTNWQGVLERIRARYTEVAGRLAWITPEILAHTPAELEAWAAAPELAGNRYAMTRLLRRKPHTLSAAEETLLSRAAEIFAAPDRIYGLLANADLKFPPVTTPDGQARELSEGRYRMFLMDPDRAVRRTAFAQLLDTYGSLKNTWAQLLATAVKAHNYTARVRNYPSALAAALHEDQVPPALYDALIAATHAALPAFARYLDLRRRRLGLPDLAMYDLHVSLVPDCDVRVPFEQARAWILAAFAPLGAEYVDLAQRAFAERWIDVLESRGKRSGAYSSGCYDSRPYLLLNYHEQLDDVFTLAHELGHSLHTWLANQRQPPRFARYPIFIAEIASTVAEELLAQHLLAIHPDPRFRAYLLNHQCDGFRGTVYRQVMFAEFEKQLHEAEAAGQPLTHEWISAAYGVLNGTYHGAIPADARIRLEWARIPHFYYNFYVYKYATSFCAAQVLVPRILAGEAGRRAYLELLAAGGSADPLDLVARAGVNLADAGVYAAGFARFDQSVTALAAALDAGDA